jgi:hypothetical protein
MADDGIPTARDGGTSTGGGDGALLRTFQGLRQQSQKWSSYFPVYESLFARFAGRSDLTIVEIGVMDGGSLVMWRSYFGDRARIIGVDYSPTAERMREQGFEIFIGDQSSPAFWSEFFATVGPVDIVIDDGGHTNAQQIRTVDGCLDHIRDGGVIVVEDVHASYLPEFGNPSRYSFLRFAMQLVERIQRRNPRLEDARRDRWTAQVHGVSFHESIVCFHIDRRLCGPVAHLTSGEARIDAINYWNVDTRLLDLDTVARWRGRLERLPFAGALRALYHALDRWTIRLHLWRENRSLRHYFRG